MSEVEKAQAAAVFKDDEPATFFDKIIAGEVPTTIVYEDDEALAFRDISPQVRT
jgi:histidine triad (HIT) family protein